MPDKITTLKLVDNTDVFPNIKDENIPNTIMRVTDLSNYLNQLKSINITGDIDSTTITSDIATFTTADITTLNVSGASHFEGEASFGHNVHVDGNLVVNGIDNIVDKDGNKIVNTGTFEPTSDNPAGQKSVAEYYGQGGEGIVNFENIVDKEGHKRFISGPIENVDTNSFFTIEYGKWSLSGTHLMCRVVAILKNANFQKGWWIFSFAFVPQWILDKIYGVVIDSDQTFIDSKNVLWNGVDFPWELRKSINMNRLVLCPLSDAPSENLGKQTVIQFDLLID